MPAGEAVIRFFAELPADRFVAHLAGGEQAMTSAIEGVEDHEDAGRAAADGVGPVDVAVGLTASGRTPYVAGALAAARSAGARTVLVSGNPDAPLAALADVHVAADTGPEAVMGSTRMKAGTAQKLVLHNLSTAAMVRLGRTYSNLMVDVVATNAKLRGRVLTILIAATGVDEDTGRRALADAGGHLKAAIVAVLSDVDPITARIRLDEAGGHVRRAIAVRP